jgi:hypothetical protein
MSGRSDRRIRPSGRAFVHRQRAWLIIGGVLISAVSLLITLAWLAPADRQSDILVNLAGSAAQIIVLAVSGGVVGAVLRDREVRREDARRRRDGLFTFERQLEVAFNEIKAARRLLRTYGFDAPKGKVLTEEQATGFRSQMAQLNDTQLTIEMDARLVAAQPELFGAAREPLIVELDGMSAFLRQVLLEWETDSTLIAAGADATRLAGWARFRSFVGYDEASLEAFRAAVTDRMSRIQTLILTADAPSGSDEAPR